MSMYHCIVTTHPVVYHTCMSLVNTLCGIGWVLQHSTPCWGPVHPSPPPTNQWHIEDALPMAHRLYCWYCWVCLWRSWCPPIQHHSRYGLTLVPITTEHIFVLWPHTSGNPCHVVYLAPKCEWEMLVSLISLLQLCKVFPNWAMQLELNATKPPDMTFSPSGGNLTVFGETIVEVVNPTNKSVQLAFVLGMVRDTRAHIWFISSLSLSVDCVC